MSLLPDELGLIFSTPSFFSFLFYRYSSSVLPLSRGNPFGNRIGLITSFDHPDYGNFGQDKRREREIGRRKFGIPTPLDLARAFNKIVGLHARSFQFRGYESKVNLKRKAGLKFFLEEIDSWLDRGIDRIIKNGCVKLAFQNFFPTVYCYLVQFTVDTWCSNYSRVISLSIEEDRLMQDWESFWFDQVLDVSFLFLYRQWQ